MSERRTRLLRLCLSSRAASSPPVAPPPPPLPPPLLQAFLHRPRPSDLQPSLNLDGFVNADMLKKHRVPARHSKHLNRNSVYLKNNSDKLFQRKAVLLFNLRGGMANGVRVPTSTKTTISRHTLSLRCTDDRRNAHQAFASQC